MSFLLISLCFLAVAAGLPFPKEFLSPPSPEPPLSYKHEGPVSENHQGFRVQQIVPDGNTVTKVVIQVPNEPHQRIYEGFQRNQIVHHYYPENEQFRKENQPAAQVIHYQNVPQRIQYVPQGVPENMPHLFLPAPQVAQAVEQIPQGIRHSVQNVEQVPHGSQQPLQQITNVQNSFVKKGVQAAQEVSHPATPIPEGIQSIQQTPSIDGQTSIKEQQPVSVQPAVHSVDMYHISKEQGAVQEIQDQKNVQSMPPSTPLQAQSVQSIPGHNAQQGDRGTFTQVQSWQTTSQNEQFPRDQKVENASEDTYKPQRISETQQSSHQQQSNPEQAVVTVQHGPNGVHVIRKGQQNAQQQQFLHQNLVQGANEQSQDIHRNEHTAAVTIAPQIIQQQEKVVHPVVHVVQHGTQGVQIIREGEHYNKHVKQERTNTQPPHNKYEESNGFPVQEVSELSNKQIDQRESNDVHHQTIVTAQHGPSMAHIVHQEEFIAQNEQRQHQQQDSQQTFNKPPTSQNDLKAVPTAQNASLGAQGLFNQVTQTAHGITPAVFNGDEQKTHSETQKIPQVQVSYEADTTNTVAQSVVPTSQSAPAQIQPSVQQAAAPSLQSSQVSHFSFGFQDNSSTKQENPKNQAIPISHFSFGTQGQPSVVKLQTQRIETASQHVQNQEIQTKPQSLGLVSDNVQHLPPSLHKLVQNVVTDVPQVSQSIKEATHGVQAIPAAVQQVSHGVHQFNQGVHQAIHSAQQVNPVSDGVRNVYNGIRDSVHPAILSSAEAYVNSIHRDKQPIESQELQQVLNQIQQVREEVHRKQESQRSQEALSQQEGSFDQENRQIPLQEEDIPQQNQKQFQPFQNQGQRGQPARPQYSNRKPVQSAVVNQIYDNTPHRVESPANDEAEPTPVPIIRYENSVSPDGTYQWSYEAGNGIKAQESGLIRNRGIPDKESIAVQGGYSYTGPDGIFYSVEYIADENGFQPLGRHLPTQPPIPEALQKAIDDHMAILATAKPETEEQPADEPVRNDNKLSSSQIKYNYSQRGT